MQADGVFSGGGIKGLAAGPDGSLYAAYPRSVQKITPAGAVTTVADPFST